MLFSVLVNISRHIRQNDKTKKNRDVLSETAVKSDLLSTQMSQGFNRQRLDLFINFARYLNDWGWLNQPQLSNVIKKRRLQWFGHLQRMDVTRLPLKLYRWIPYHGKRKPGRSRTTWKDVIKRDLDSLMTGWTLEEAEVAARDRKIWGYVRQQVHRCTMLFDDDDYDDLNDNRKDDMKCIW